MIGLLLLQHGKRPRQIERDSRFYDYESPEQAAPRNFTREMLQTLQGYQQTAPGYLSLEQQYRLPYGQLGLQQQQQSLYGYDDASGHHPGTLELGLGQQQTSLYGYDDANGQHHPGTLELGLGQQQTSLYGYTDANGQHHPGTLELGLGQQGTSLLGYDDATGHHQGTLELGRFGTEFGRAGDIADVQRYGPASTEAFLAANPFLASGLTNLLGRSQDSDILKTLNAQANQGLAAGGRLSPQEQRMLDQQSRMSFSDRGNVYGNQSIASELLNRDAAVRARQQQAQQFASGVQGLNQAQNDFTGRATQIFGTQLSDPFQAILGRSSGSAGSSGGGGNAPVGGTPVGGASIGGPVQQQIGTGAQLFDPTNAYAADIYSSNANQQASNNIATANANNAQTSGYLALAGTILGGLLSDERVKTNVKKTGKTTESGVDLYEYEYLTDPEKKRYRSGMAQDIEIVNPDAVWTDPISNIKVVKYEKTDVPFERVLGKGKGRKYLDLVTGELRAA